jgi:hypothetical protein
MKRILIGTLVGALVFFAYQSIAWMSGFHDDFALYSPNQETILQSLNENLKKDGLYYLPSIDPQSSDYQEKHQEQMKECVGKPWAMVFYHKAMGDMSISYILMGFLYSLIANLMVTLLLFFGKFGSFAGRFLVSMSVAIFAISQGVMDEFNWWSYPWSFIKPQVIDLTLGWGLCSLWLAYFVKNTHK